MEQYITRARRLIQHLPPQGLRLMLLETECGKTYQELLAVTMMRQDEKDEAVRRSHAAKAHIRTDEGEVHISR